MEDNQGNIKTTNIFFIVGLIALNIIYCILILVFVVSRSKKIMNPEDFKVEYLFLIRKAIVEMKVNEYKIKHLKSEKKVSQLKMEAMSKYLDIVRIGENMFITIEEAQTRKEELRKLMYQSEGSNICLICCVKKPDILIVPCGHCCLCLSCFEELTKNKNDCPICRAKMSEGIQFKLLSSGDYVEVKLINI